MSDGVRDGGFDNFLDAVAAGEPFYLETPDGDALLPPAGHEAWNADQELTERPLPVTGEILTHTMTNVATPQFADDAPFVVALAEFGPVTLTGQVRGIDPDDVTIGQAVTLAVVRTETADERMLVFEPV